MSVAKPTELPEIALARYAAYSRYSAYQKAFQLSLQQPDATDLGGDAVIFVARGPNHELWGSVRVISSAKLTSPLPQFATEVIPFPGDYTFVDRLFVTEDAPQSIASALLGCVWEWSLASGKSAMVALAGVALARHYKKLGGLLPLTAEPQYVPEDLHEPVHVVGALLPDAWQLVGEINPKFQATLTPPKSVKKHPNHEH